MSVFSAWRSTEQLQFS